ncbi:MAG: helix-turn-helix domain-containing protein [Ruminococcaceae bacterium]|nr:helix-turn-helix domain-containing protein [Oscillospiraceae bacterium]
MDKVIQKILKLQEARGWSEYRLAEETGISRSTIASWFSSGTLPNITSLKKVCDVYGITLSQFFAEEGEAVTLTEQQKELLDNWINLEANQQEALLAFLKLM